MNIYPRPEDKLIVVDESGLVDCRALYSAIAAWSESTEGMSYEDVAEGSGFVELPSGVRTDVILIMLRGWRIASEHNISIVNGLVAGRNEDGTTYSPVSSAPQRLVEINSEPEFALSDSQKSDARRLGDDFGEDWELVIDGYPQLRRKSSASSRKRSVLAMYWFLKQAYLQNLEMRKFVFPMGSDNFLPGVGLVRHWRWMGPSWIAEPDLEYLEDGPLVHGDGTELVPPAHPEPLPSTVSSSRTIAIQWIPITSANQESFAQLESAIDTLYEYVAGNNELHIAERQQVLAALQALRQISEYQGVWNWAGVYAGETLEQVIRDSVYELMKPKVKDALVWLGAILVGTT